MNAPVQAKPHSSPDTATVIAIALIAYALGSVIHEGLGHGGACVLTGHEPLVVSSVHFECSQDTRLISAGGTIVNFIAGVLCWAASRLVKRNSRVRYFLWLLMTINLFTAAGYFLFSGIGGIGDWADVIRGFQPLWAWRLLLTAFGILAYAACVWFSLYELLPFLGSDQQRRTSRAWRLTLIPYLAGGIQSCIAGAFNPVGMILVAISAAAASFGGTSGLAWMTNLLHNPKISSSNIELPEVARSFTWIAVASACTVIFVFIVGPGIKLHG